MKQLIYTENGLMHLQQYLKDCKSLFFVHGHHSYRACGAEVALKPMIGTIPFVTEFADFSTNPKDEEARKGAKLLIQSGADKILVVGGGSAIDSAKLIRHYALEKGIAPSLIAIPTTAGTGAESTHFAVSYINGTKTSIEADDILPDVAIIYPPFTYHNDAYLTACTGFDALAQAIEAYWNKFATEESDTLALKAIMYLHEQLPKCVEASTPDLRNSLAIGANLAGQAINITKTTAPHAFSYAFTSKCGYPHGHAVALTFPFFAELNMQNNPKAMELRYFLNLKPNESFQEYFLEYVKEIGLTYKGVGEYNLEDILNEVNTQRLKNNPQDVSIDDLKAYFVRFGK